ncbi:hypothetical protein MARU1_000550 [Malassezia arunalokei]|uniref:SH3 domain-containing protein n=1 Tax=Malassezia arunalokei TaxID=1514897 RepID=A0AAJ6CIX0_9BASI|nr:hypothetical protein MARU1_000550 [Malassezia arunalokei]
MFALPEKDRQAFFGILDEYFSQRPHLLNGNTHEIRRPEGLTTGKSIGKLDVSSPGSALKSAFKNTTEMVQNRIQQNARTQEVAHAVPSMDSAAQADAPPAEATTAMSSGLGEATALYTFQGAQAGDLSITQGERIVLLDKVNDDWFRAQSVNGAVGIVPANYIQRT